MNYKQQAAKRALDYVQSGMVVGLGSGSTTQYFVHFLGERLRTGQLKGILGVPTSEATAVQAETLGVPLTSLEQNDVLDIAVDGADEVDPKLNLIKGLGRALLREKIVEIHAKQFIVIADQSKFVNRLGTRGPLPVEIVPFAAEIHVRWLGTLGCQAELWLEEDGSTVRTDNGNYLARCWFPNGIIDPYDLAARMAGRAGIVEHGLFMDMAHRVILAGDEGIRILERNS